MMNVITAFKSGNWNVPKCWKRGKDGVISGTISKIQHSNKGAISGTVSSCGIQNQARCYGCDKLLAEGFFVFNRTVNNTNGTISIKCGRCKSMNTFHLSDYFKA
jgi:phage FluMu protein Com